MSCFRIGNAIVCSSLGLHPGLCKELLYSVGRSCRKCPIETCRYCGLLKREVMKKERERWTRNNGKKSTPA